MILSSGERSAPQTRRTKQYDSGNWRTAPTVLNARLRRIEGRHNALVKELRQAFSRGELTSDGYCAIEGFRILDEAIRSGLRFRAVFFSESAAAQGGKAALPARRPGRDAPAARQAVCRAPSPATRPRAWPRWRAGRNSRSKTCWPNPKPGPCWPLRECRTREIWDNPALGGGLRRRRSAAGRGHGQPFQSQSCAGFGRFGIPAAGGASETV